MPPPIVELKLKESFVPFSDLNEEELSRTWRVCTKVKDSLENGSRLENLSWRLWFIQNVLLANDVKKSKNSNTNTTKETVDIQPAMILSEETADAILNYSLDDIKPDIGTNNFILNQFTSDQEGNQMIELKDIFPQDMQNGIDNTIYNNNYPAWESSSYGYNHENYVNNVSQPLNNNINPTIIDPITGINTNNNFNVTPSMTIPIDDPSALVVDYNNPNPNSFVTNAVAFTSIPNVTLYNKLLATLPRQTLVSAERLLQSPQLEKSTKRNYASTIDTLVCTNCQATSTPLWRRSNEDKVLCNACGLYLKLHQVPRPKRLKTTSGKAEDEPKKLEPQTICSNCGTSKTPLWRRNMDGTPLCNACGLYLKLHNQKRPLSMKTDVIKKRTRTEALIAQSSNNKLKYFDQNSLYSNQNNSKGSNTTLPGTGILMMSTNNTKKK